MLVSEMKALITSLGVQRSTLRCLFFVFIVTNSGKCVPRHSPGSDRTLNEEFKRRSSHQQHLGTGLSDNALDDDFYFKNKIAHSHNALDHREDKFKKDRSFKNLPLSPLFDRKGKHHIFNTESQDEDPVSSFDGHRDKEEWKDADSARRKDSSHLPKSNGLFAHAGRKNLYGEPPDENTSAHEPRLDAVLNDIKPQKATGSETIIDYYFVDDAAEPHLGLPKHGIIINLRGLIPAEVEDEDDDDEDDVIPEPTSHDGGKIDEVLAYKAFEISPSPPVEDPGRLQSEFDDQFPEEAIDIKSPKTYAAPHIESRNLSRKRRQKSSPNQEDDRKGRGYFRRRRRKRKRRQRHSKSSDDAESDLKIRGGEVIHDERYLLRSSSPAYVITSANEVKKDWCRTVPLKQKITEPNCKPRVLMNNFCYGQCNSFFIPHNGRTGTGAAFQSCAFCKPHRSHWTTVTLQCPGQTPPKIAKRVLMVESCRCKTEILQSA